MKASRAMTEGGFSAAPDYDRHLGKRLREPESDRSTCLRATRSLTLFWAGDAWGVGAAKDDKIEAE